MSDERGFVAIEWVLAVALLLLPIVVLVATLPGWVERRHAAGVAAREVATIVVQDGGGVDVGEATRRADEVAQNYGVEPDDIDVSVRGASGRGEYVTVEVRVRMPAISVPGLVEAGGWTFTATQHRRLDDYRSR